MAPHDIAEVLRRVRDTWGSLRETIVAEAILSFLEQHAAAANIPFATFLKVAQLAGCRENATVSNVVSYLSGPGVDVLTIKFEMIDDESHVRELEDDEVDGIYERGINPLTGEEDPDIKEKILMFFAPSENFRRIARGGS